MNTTKLGVAALVLASVVGCDAKPTLAASEKPAATEKQLEPWERCPYSMQPPALEDCVSVVRKELREQAVAQGGTWLVSTDADWAIFINLGNVQARAASEKAAWITTVSRSSGRDKKSGKPYKFALQRSVYDCAARRSALVQLAVYQEDGTPLGTSQTDDANPAFSNVVPGSTGEQQLEFVCDPAKALDKHQIIKVPAEFGTGDLATELAFTKYIYGLKNCETPKVVGSAAPSDAEWEAFTACTHANDRWMASVLGKQPSATPP